MEYKKITFIETINFLIQKYNLNINNNNFNYHYNLDEKILNLNTLCNYFFIKNLKNNKKKIKYLIKKRKINKKLIIKFQLGSFDYNTNKLLLFLKKNNINNNLLFNSGFLIKKKNKIFNIFQNSIIFPIYNKLGYILGFGAKKFNNKIRYINCYENKIFKKKKILYGIYYSQKYIIQYNYCIITEGYIDFISLYRINIKNVIATLGVNITNYQINQIKNLTKNIYIIYDNDYAGINGTKKIIKLLLKNNFNIKIFLLKKNYDIDKYIIKNKKKNIKKNIKKKSVCFMLYLLKIYKYNIIKNIQIKYFIIKKIIKYINIIDSYICKYFYIKKLSKILKINKFILLKELLKIDKKNKIIFYKQNFSNYKKKKKKKKNFLEKYIIKYIIIYSIQYFIFKKNKKEYKYILLFFKNKNIKFFNKKYKYIYKKIINKNKIYNIIYKKKILNFFIKKYFIKNKINKIFILNIKKILNIIYNKYKIFILNKKIKKIYNIYNKKNIKKIYILIKKKILLQKKIFK
ncbi:MAG: toprim domain-containing protein [Candidatus Shikimatogenerans sp. Ttur]|uniref:Toprim domain-containing protein n=1 Tax=Candidatus Shikimatogenerans sp. Ttur TaxID=3158569 RepID=A0AAU7ZY84_9FLAO